MTQPDPEALAERAHPEEGSLRPAIAKLRAETAMAVPGPQVFPFDVGLIVTVTNWTETDEAGARHRGLLVEVALEASDPIAALQRAQGPASVVVSMMSFAHAAAAGPLRPWIAYTRRDERDCDVVQFEQWPIEASSRRIVKKDRLEPTVARMNSLPPQDRERVIRGLDWYRKALGETNVFDRFGALWIGLETINPLLIRRRSLPTTQTIRSCSKCGEPVVTMDTIAGITDLLERGFGEEQRRTVQRFRQKYMHSTQPLHEIASDADASAKTAREALRTGLLELLNASPEEVGLLGSTPMRLPERNLVRYSYRMRPLHITGIPLGQATPRLEARHVSGERTTDEEGRTQERLVHELEIRDFGGEIPPPFEWWVSIPSADPDDRRRQFEMRSFEIIDKKTGETIQGTATPILKDAEEAG